MASWLAVSRALHERQVTTIRLESETFKAVISLISREIGVW